MFCEVLEKQLKENKTKCKSQLDKLYYSNITSGKIVKKYKSVVKFSSLVNPYLQKKYSSSNNFLKKRMFKSNSLKDVIRNFFEKNENSAPAPGKREVIYKFGKSMRKRYLCDTLSNLHKKFKN